MSLPVKGVSNLLFVTTIGILVVLSGIGFGLYGLSSAATHSSSTVSVVTSTRVMNASVSNNLYMFSNSGGSMFSGGWLITAPLGMHEYAMSIKAEGLEPARNYIVEGIPSSGAMQAVPISTESMTMNTTSASEFQSDSNGTGLFWIELTTDPTSAFEQIDLVFLPGMSMQNATTVAVVSFQMNSETMMQTSSNTGI